MPQLIVLLNCLSIPGHLLRSVEEAKLNDIQLTLCKVLTVLLTKTIDWIGIMTCQIEFTYL